MTVLNKSNIVEFLPLKLTKLNLSWNKHIENVVKRLRLELELCEESVNLLTEKLCLLFIML
jgi:hypothetical protein